MYKLTSNNKGKDMDAYSLTLIPFVLNVCSDQRTRNFSLKETENMFGGVWIRKTLLNIYSRKSFKLIELLS